MTSGKAEKILGYKLVLEHHRDKQRLAIFEFVVWKLRESNDYPDGVKYRAWLSENGSTVFGLDNHKPKGPHLHIGGLELEYIYRDLESLKKDLITMVRKEGFIIDE